MKKALILYAVVAGLAGFLFGFDVAVISGAEQDIQTLWKLDDLTHGVAIATALYGTILGAMFAGIPLDRAGRKKTLIAIGILYFISSLGSALAPEIYSFMIFRFIGGLGVGASSVAAPLYISEISPAHARGKLVMLFQLNIVVGIFIAYVSNYVLDGYSANDWRIMLGIAAAPALLFIILAVFIIESPRWLILKKHDVHAAAVALKLINPGNEESQIEVIRLSNNNETMGAGSLYRAKYKWPLILVLSFAFFNQVSGINAILYYAPRILEKTGLSADSSLLSTAGIGLTNMLFTVIGMFLIDHAGRKKLMYIGSVGLTVILGIIANAFHSESFAGIAPLFLGYIAFFAISQGAVIWVFFSELFPDSVRASGQAFGSFSHWIFAAIITNIFPFALNKFGPAPLFSFFSCMMVLQLIFVWKLMPETKGVPLEQINEKLGISS